MDSNVDGSAGVETRSSLTNSPSNSSTSSEATAAVLSPALLNQLWSKVQDELQSKLDTQIFDAYIKTLSLLAFDPLTESFTIAVPSRLVLEIVQKNHQAEIEKALIAKLGLSKAEIRFELPAVKPNIQKQSGKAIMPPPGPRVVVKKHRSATVTDLTARRQAKFGSSNGLNPKYTFDNFVVGSNSQFCHAAAMKVAEEPGRNYNPLLIYGGVGLGKTHLLHAIGNAVLDQNPSKRVVYMSSEGFMNDLISSLRRGKIDEFKNRLRNVEVILIDDIQFISGKERTQEEFFHTFNALYSAKHQIVITSDKLPQEINGLEERLKTRFAWGLIADLQAPDFETRVAILNRKATIDGVDLPPEVAQLIARSISSNVRELEGALTRLQAVSSLQQTKITEALAGEVLKPMLEPKVINISVDDIKKVVAVEFGLKVSDLSSKRRTRNLSFPRHIAMYLCRKHTTCSYPEIGSLFGGRDHSSVIHAANVVSKKIKNDPEIRAIVEKVDGMLRV